MTDDRKYSSLFSAIHAIDDNENASRHHPRSSKQHPAPPHASQQHQIARASSSSSSSGASGPLQQKIARASSSSSSGASGPPSRSRTSSFFKGPLPDTLQAPSSREASPRSSLQQGQRLSSSPRPSQPVNNQTSSVPGPRTSTPSAINLQKESPVASPRSSTQVQRLSSLASPEQRPRTGSSYDQQPVQEPRLMQEAPRLSVTPEQRPRTGSSYGQQPVQELRLMQEAPRLSGSPEQRTRTWSSYGKQPVQEPRLTQGAPRLSGSQAPRLSSASTIQSPNLRQSIGSSGPNGVSQVMQSPPSTSGQAPRSSSRGSSLLVPPVYETQEEAGQYTQGHKRESEPFEPVEDLTSLRMPSQVSRKSSYVNVPQVIEAKNSDYPESLRSPRPFPQSARASSSIPSLDSNQRSGTDAYVTGTDMQQIQSPRASVQSTRFSPSGPSPDSNRSSRTRSYTAEGTGVYKSEDEGVASPRLSNMSQNASRFFPLKDGGSSASQSSKPTASSPYMLTHTTLPIYSSRNSGTEIQTMDEKGVPSDGVTSLNRSLSPSRSFKATEAHQVTESELMIDDTHRFPKPSLVRYTRRSRGGPSILEPQELLPEGEQRELIYSQRRTSSEGQKSASADPSPSRSSRMGSYLVRHEAYPQMPTSQTSSLRVSTQVPSDVPSRHNSRAVSSYDIPKVSVIEGEEFLIENRMMPEDTSVLMSPRTMSDTRFLSSVSSPVSDESSRTGSFMTESTSEPYMIEDEGMPSPHISIRKSRGDSYVKAPQVNNEERSSLIQGQPPQSTGIIRPSHTHLEMARLSSSPSSGWNSVVAPNNEGFKESQMINSVGVSFAESPSDMYGIERDPWTRQSEQLPSMQTPASDRTSTTAFEVGNEQREVATAGASQSPSGRVSRISSSVSLAELTNNTTVPQDTMVQGPTTLLNRESLKVFPGTNAANVERLSQASTAQRLGEHAFGTDEISPVRRRSSLVPSKASLMGDLTKPDGMRSPASASLLEAHMFQSGIEQSGDADFSVPVMQSDDFEQSSTGQLYLETQVPSGSIKLSRTLSSNPFIESQDRVDEDFTTMDPGRVDNEIVPLETKEDLPANAEVVFATPAVPGDVLRDRTSLMVSSSDNEKDEGESQPAGSRTTMRTSRLSLADGLQSSKINEPSASLSYNSSRLSLNPSFWQRSSSLSFSQQIQKRNSMADSLQLGGVVGSETTQDENESSSTSSSEIQTEEKGSSSNSVMMSMFTDSMDKQQSLARPSYVGGPYVENSWSSPLVTGDEEGIRQAAPERRSDSSPSMSERQSASHYMPEGLAVPRPSSDKVRTSGTFALPRVSSIYMRDSKVDGRKSLVQDFIYPSLSSKHSFKQSTKMEADRSEAVGPEDLYPLSSSRLSSQESLEPRKDLTEMQTQEFVYSLPSMRSLLRQDEGLEGDQMNMPAPQYLYSSVSARHSLHGAVTPEKDQTEVQNYARDPEDEMHNDDEMSKEETFDGPYLGESKQQFETLKSEEEDDAIMQQSTKTDGFPGLEDSPGGLKHVSGSFTSFMKVPFGAPELSYQGYARSHFIEPTAGIWPFVWKSVAMQDLIAFTKEPLRQPLLQSLVDSHHKQSAVIAFAHLMAYMGDIPTKQDLVYHIQQLLMLGIKFGELRDEIFCQICKQTTANPSRWSNGRGWQAMALSVGTFLPSAVFQPFLEAHLQQVASHFVGPWARDNLSYQEEGRSNPARAAAYCLMRFQKICEAGPRQIPPLHAEISAVERMEEIKVNIYLPDDTFKVLSIDPMATVEEVTETLVQMNGLSDPKFYGIFQVLYADVTVEKVLSRNDYIMEVLSEWNKASLPSLEQDSRLLAKAKLLLEKHILCVPNAAVSFFEETYEADGEEFESRMDPSRSEMLLKRRLYTEELNSLPLDVRDAVKNFDYVQTIRDVVHGIYPIEERDAVMLGALQLRADSGFIEHLEDALTDEMVQKFGPKVYVEGSEREWKAALLKTAATLPHEADTSICINDYMEFLQSRCFLYGSCWYYVKVHRAFSQYI